MLVSIAIMILLIIVVFAFVLEPVLRARQDRNEYDAEDVIVIPDFRMYLDDDGSGMREDEESEEVDTEQSPSSSIPEARRIESQS